MKIYLSIIIAVHNMADYISACLNSTIVAMKYEYDYEIILVDDSSYDATSKIMKEYANKYSYIHYFYVEFKNIGRVRQYALDKCRGKYFTILDGDDIFYGDFLKKILIFLRKEDFDLLVTPIEGRYIKKYNTPKNILKKDFIKMYSKGKVIQGHFAGKFYQTELLKKIGIENKEFYEDEYTLLKAIPMIKKIFFSKTKFYSYIKRKNSLTNYTSDRQIFERINLEKTKLQMLNRKELITYCSSINELSKLPLEYLHEESIKFLIEKCRKISMVKFILSPFIRFNIKKKYLKLKITGIL